MNSKNNCGWNSIYQNHSIIYFHEEQFREAQTDAAYNHHLLQEHLQAEEHIAAERAEQEALLDSSRFARKSRLEHWRYRMQVAKAAAAYKEASKEGDEAGEALFGETEDEVEDNAGSDESPLHWRRRGPAPSSPVAPTTRQRTPPAPPRPRPANNEAEDIAGSAEAPPCRQCGGGFPPLRRGAARRQRDRGHRWLRRGPAPLPTRPPHTENEEE